MIKFGQYTEPCSMPMIFKNAKEVSTYIKKYQKGRVRKFYKTQNGIEGLHVITGHLLIRRKTKNGVEIIRLFEDDIIIKDENEIIDILVLSEKAIILSYIESYDVILPQDDLNYSEELIDYLKSMGIEVDKVG